MRVGGDQFRELNRGSLRCPASAPGGDPFGRAGNTLHFIFDVLYKILFALLYTAYVFFEINEWLFVGSFFGSAPPAQAS